MICGKVIYQQVYLSMAIGPKLPEYYVTGEMPWLQVYKCHFGFHLETICPTCRLKVALATVL